VLLKTIPRVAYLLFLLLFGSAGCLSSGGRLPADATVQEVIDGDTVRLSDGRLVRYLGIDAPELRRKEGNEWVEINEPFSGEATQRNRELVEGKRVRLEYDKETHDRYGRLLAYVFVDKEMINAQIVEEGLADPLFVVPNLKYVPELQARANRARRAKRGMWGARVMPSDAVEQPGQAIPDRLQNGVN